VTTRSLTLHAALAPAADAPAGSREREGILVPWDQPGRANIGPFGVVGDRGLMVRRQFASSLRPDLKVVGVYGHNRPGVDSPSVSRVVALENRDEGLWARIRVGRTALGDQLLAEMDDGVRDGLSVEVTDLQFDSAGHVVGGSLDYFAHVAVGAYDSARVSTLAAALTTPPNGEAVTLAAHTPAPAAATTAPVLQANLAPTLQANLAPAATPAPAAPAAPAADPAPAQPAQPAQPDLPALLAAMFPQTPAPAPAAPAQPDNATLMAQFVAAMAQLQAGAHVAPAGPSAVSMLGAPNVPAAPAGTAANPVREVATLQAQVAAGDRTLMAALADVTYTGLPLFQQPPGVIGEKLWEGGAYTRRWTTLMRPKELTSMKGSSWQWTRGPEVAAWAGNKADVPSNPVSAEEVPWTARRCAGAWDIGRELRDFGTPEFWEEFYAEQVESYLELSDTWAAEFLVASARSIAVDGNVPASYLELDRTIDAGPTQILKAAALGTAIMEDTPRVKTGPDWIAMNVLDWLTLADLTALDLPAFLALLKVNPGSFMRSSLVPQGQVIMGVKQATTFRELGNGAPIRVEALDVARGGIDSAVYGYVGYSHDRPGGVISVPLAAAV
jgi:hypothetical protein